MLDQHVIKTCNHNMLAQHAYNIQKYIQDAITYVPHVQYTYTYLNIYVCICIWITYEIRFAKFSSPCTPLRTNSWHWSGAASYCLTIRDLKGVPDLIERRWLADRKLMGGREAAGRHGSPSMVPYL